MHEIPVLPWKGVEISKTITQKKVVFNSQNYDGYPVLIALTLPGHLVPNAAVRVAEMVNKMTELHKLR